MTSKIVRSDGTTNIADIKSVIYKETVNVGDGLRPGCVASAYIEVEVIGSQSSAPSSGEALTYYQVDFEGNETLIGTFYAEPSIATRTSYKFVAYDAVSKLDKSFSEQLNAIQNSFPMSVYDIVSEACNIAGVTLGSTSWPMSTMQVQAFYADNLTCRNILQYAAELAGRFVRCDTNGNVIFDWYTTNSTYSIHPGASQSGWVAYKQDGLTYDNYTVVPVDAVAIRPVGSEGAAYIYPTSYANVVVTDPNGDGNIILENLTVTDDGNGNLYLSVDATDPNYDGNVTISNSVSASNTLIIGNNLLLMSAAESVYNEAAENIYNVMSALPTYRHATAQLFTGENPFGAGEFVSITDSQGVSFTAPIFEMTVQDSGAIIRSSGNETLDTDSSGSDVQKTLNNMSANIVQIDKLKVNYAEIDQLIANWIQTGRITVRDENGNIIFDADAENHTVQFGGSTASDGTINGGTIEGAYFHGGSLRIDEERPNGDTAFVFIREIINGEYTKSSTNTKIRFELGGPDNTHGSSLVFSDKLSGSSGFTERSVYGAWGCDVYGNLTATGEIHTNNQLTIGTGTPSTITAQKVSKWDTKSDELGDIDDLDTTDKTSVVGAINETLQGQAAVALAPTQYPPSGVTIGFLRAYRIGGLAVVNIEFTMSDALSDWTTIASGFPTPPAAWYDFAFTSALSYVRPARVRITTGGLLQIRYGSAATFDAAITYPIA